MKKLLVEPRSLMTLLSSLIAITILLQSCCFGPVGLAKTPCNCANNKPVYAANNKPGTTTMNETTRSDAKTAQQDPSLLHTALPVNSAPQNTAQAYPPLATNTKMRDTKKLPLGIKGIRSHVIAGPNLSFKSSKEDGNSDYKKKPGVGFQFGFGSSLSFSSKFAVSTGLVFKKNTAKEVFSYSVPGEPGGGSSSEDLVAKYSYSYLSVPLLAEYKISDQITAIAGPEVNFLTGASVKSSGYGNTEKTDIKDQSAKAGVSIKAGIKYTIAKSPIALQVVYDHRLSRLNEKSESYYPGSSYDTPAWKMSDLSLGVVCEICNLLALLKH